MDIIIREEHKKDYQEVYDLVKKTFETAAVRDGDEQDYAAQLRFSENFIPPLSLVAEYEGRLIGQIMFTKTNIVRDNKIVCTALLLSPLSVLIEYRKMGVGSALIQEGFRLARELGFSIVFVCGDPAYYSKFGFKSISYYDIRPINDFIPIKYIMVSELFPKTLDGVDGMINVC